MQIVGIRRYVYLNVIHGLCTTWPWSCPSTLDLTFKCVCCFTDKLLLLFVLESLMWCRESLQLSSRTQCCKKKARKAIFMCAMFHSGPKRWTEQNWHQCLKLTSVEPLRCQTRQPLLLLSFSLRTQSLCVWSLTKPEWTRCWRRWLISRRALTASFTTPEPLFLRQQRDSDSDWETSDHFQLFQTAVSSHLVQQRHTEMGVFQICVGQTGSNMTLAPAYRLRLDILYKAY